MMKKVVRLGTRRSQLALWQANHIAGLIRRHHANVAVEIHEYRTRSDRNMSAPLRSISGGGLFTDALEAALLAREIDCAVHSLKDMPVKMTAGLALAAVPKRGDHRDALVSRSGAGLDQLRQGARIGTGSLRRRAQLLAIKPDLQMMQIRGNVPTRLEKLRADDGQFDAIVLAAAGLNRLGLAARISQIFDEGRMLCAAGQGALAVQCRDDSDDLAFFGPLADWRATISTLAERTFLSVLEAGCSLPVAAYARVDGDRLLFKGRVIALDGSGQLDVAGETGAIEGAAGLALARELGARLAEKALERGARRILETSEIGEDQ